jgi:CBS domain-containing protein
MIQNILDRKGTEVVTIRGTETVKSAADRMRELGIAALVVKSADAINGVISEREIVEAVSQHGEGASRWRCWTSRLAPSSASPPPIA